ncbi:hypothetical protein SCUCBS95973_002690 [Sporothrix curviconia]|uniref:Transmembrane protein n=1 Tax=Sporothrix curviconia TaxID=1260050 RepID=A0ABP0B981_9PEZI
MFTPTATGLMERRMTNISRAILPMVELSASAVARATDSIYYRGSCTFRDWSDGSNCPTICLTGSGISPHTNVGVIPCPGSETKWYCADGNMGKANCSSGAFIVSLPTRFLYHSWCFANADDTYVHLDTYIAVKQCDNSSANVPLAVGVTIGGTSIIAACVIGYFIWRRKTRDEPAVAESPPPRDMPDDEIMNAVLAGPLFRSASLLSRRPSKTNLNMMSGDEPPPPMPDTASILSSNRADSLRSGSLLSTFQHQQHQQHGYPQDRFGSDVVAMHSMRRTPPAGWHYHNGHPSTTEPIPEIPYDGRRLAPYHGVPILEHDGFSELPG